jgi:hypothetical protein
VTQNSQSLPGLCTVSTVSSCTRTIHPSTRTSKKLGTATLRYRSGQAPTAPNQTAGQLGVIVHATRQTIADSVIWTNFIIP